MPGHWRWHQGAARHPTDEGQARRPVAWGGDRCGPTVPEKSRARGASIFWVFAALSGKGG